MPDAYTFISISPFTFINYLSAATITGNTQTYQNETINSPIIAADASTSNVKELILNDTQVTVNSTQLSSNPWPSAVSLGGSNGYLVNAGWGYGDLTLSVDKTSTVSAQASDVGTIIYVRTDTPDSLVTVNNAGNLSLTSNSTTTSGNTNGILAENLSQADTSKVSVNIQDGSNIDITSGTNIRGVVATGAELNITTDKNSQITLTNTTNSSNNMTGIILNGRASSGNNYFTLENNGAITINGGQSTGVKTGISAVLGKEATINNTGNINITGDNGTGINISTQSGNVTSSGDINVTGSNANGIVVNSTGTTVSDTQNLTVAGNITIDGTSNGALSTVNSAIRLNNQTQGTGVITYDDANGSVSVTGTSTGQTPSNNASGFYLYSDKGADALIDIKNISEIKIESPNSMGISAYSTGGTGSTQINFTNGLLTTSGSNADGIIVTNQNDGGDILINQGGDVSAVSTDNIANASPTEGVYATKDNTKGNVVINSTGNIEVEAKNATAAGANYVANGSATFNFDNSNKHITAKGSAYSTT